MATDSTELTFVRCPSCRSLVPAVSTRCRMCGTALDAGAAAEESSEPKSSGRVRQKTMSVPPGEVAEHIERFKEETAPAGDSSAPIPPTPIQGAPVEDPLSGFLEEVEESVMASPAATPASSMIVETPAAASPVKGATPDEDPLASLMDDEPAVLLDEEPTEEVAPPEATPALHAGVTRRQPTEVLGSRKDEKPRVILEQGGKRQGKNGLSFGGKPREEQAPQQQPQQDQRPPRQEQPRQEARPPREEQPRQETRPPREEVKSQREEPRDAKGDRRDDRPRQDRPRDQGREAPRSDRRDDRPQRGGGDRPRDERRDATPAPGRGDDRGQRAWPKPNREGDAVTARDDSAPHAEGQPMREARSAGKPASAGHTPTRAEGVSGRLHGWLVNYSDPDGRAIELREGRFFVSASTLKPTDLVVSDPSISTPHALVIVGLETGLQVQDLMSERGVFLRSRDDAAYRREYDTAQLQHGDWVRFGDVEFLVSLIAHVGVK